MSEPITNLSDAVAALGALPVPVGPGTQSGAYARRRAALGVVHGAWKRQAPTAVTAVTALDHAGLLLSPEVAAELEGLRSQVAALLAERHSTNESLDEAAKALRADRDRIAELERDNADAVVVSESLCQALQDEKLAGSAMYSALTQPTTPEQRQAALDRFLAVAQRSGQMHGPVATGGAPYTATPEAHAQMRAALSDYFAGVKVDEPQAGAR